MKSIDKTYLQPLSTGSRLGPEVAPRTTTLTAIAGFLRPFLKSGLYLAAILLVPGALIGAPILWWLGHRRKVAATGVDNMLLTQRCQQPWRRLGAD